jgi:hypothetical protein
MRVWDKVQELERQYRQAREMLLSNKCDSVEVIVHLEPKKINAPKPAAKTNRSRQAQV